MPTIRSPEHWLARADEARNLATLIRDPEARAAMLEIAANYEKLAKMARDATRAPDPQ
jgi:hypothetical protein